MTTYYVRIDGHDGATGLNDTSNASTGAKLTIAGGSAAMSASDRLEIRAGTFYERKLTFPSGSAGNPTIINGAGVTTIIDGSESFDGSWVTAPEIGTGVYKKATRTWDNGDGFTYDINYLSADGLSIDRINYELTDGTQGTDEWYGLTWQQMMSMAASGTTGLRQEAIDVGLLWWDAFGNALFAIHAGNCYIRFKGSDDPNSKTIRVSPWVRYGNATYSPVYAVISLISKSYVTIQNTKITGTANPVGLDGSDHIIVINDTLITSNVGVQLRNTTSSTVSTNTITTNNKAYQTYAPGAWDGDANYNTPGHIATWWRRYEYENSKYVKGLYGGSLNDSGVLCIGASTTPTIYNNTISTLIGGVVAGHDVLGNDDMAGLSITQNAFTNHEAAIWLGSKQASSTIEIGNNTFLNITAAVRWNQDAGANSAASVVYIYGNRIFNALDPHVGWLLHFTSGGTTPNADALATIWVYHNTIVGGKNATLTFYQEGYGYPKLRYINNLWQPGGGPLSTGEGGTSGYSWQDNDTDSLCASGKIGDWDYNWVYTGTYSHGAPSCPWVRGNNVANTSKIWTNNDNTPDWIVTGTTAQAAGIDISQTFVINSISYGALPGFSPGYFTGALPNIGAVQEGSVPPPTGPNMLAISYTVQMFSGPPF